MSTQSSLDFLERLRQPSGSDLLPVAGSFEITLKCNVRCKHCYILYPGATSDEMSTSEIKQTLDLLADNGVVLLLITGGEPLSRPDF
jgi:MoaA/NifB/PqqE/SkfB family radical SAM enzyme